MTYLTEGMEPAHVLRFFEDICRIPHGSGNEAEMAQFIMTLAAEQGLAYEQDQHGNVLVHLYASPGCEEAPMFLMQGHMDMVLAKEDWVTLDLNTDPVPLRRDGNLLYAEGTTLGADNAVGLCNMLAVMTDKTVKHPPMELLFTVREERGLEGIALFDASLLKSRRMLTMDCGDPDVLMLGSAGSLAYDLCMNLEQEDSHGKGFCVELSGLHGGHTGLEIGNGYANALSLMTTILAALEAECGAKLVSLEVGGGSGSIPRSAKSIVLLPSSCRVSGDVESPAHTADSVLVRAVSIVDQYAAIFRSEFELTEDSLEFGCGQVLLPETMLTAESTRALLDFLTFYPCGDQKRHAKVQTQVMGSALIKNASLKEGVFTGQYAIRSNTDAYKYILGSRFERLCRHFGVEHRIVKDMPAWPEKPQSHLKDLCLEVYRDCFGIDLKTELVHGGEEASIIAREIPDMEIVGIAPYSRGAHTTSERLHLDTMLPVWNFLTALLARLAEERV